MMAPSDAPNLADFPALGESLDPPREKVHRPGPMDAHRERNSGAQLYGPCCSRARHCCLVASRRRRRARRHLYVLVLILPFHFGRLFLILICVLHRATLQRMDIVCPLHGQERYPDWTLLSYENMYVCMNLYPCILLCTTAWLNRNCSSFCRASLET